MHVSLRHRRTKLWLSLSAKQHQDPSSGPTAVYQDLSMYHNRPVKKPLSICQSGWKEIWKALLVICPLEAQNKDIGAASQILQTEVKSCLWCTQAN